MARPKQKRRPPGKGGGVRECLQLGGSGQIEVYPTALVTATSGDLAATSCATERAMAEWIAGYREAALPPEAMLRSALAKFPLATASTFAVALGRANRVRAKG